VARGGYRGQVRADQCGHVREIAQGSIPGPSGGARSLCFSLSLLLSYPPHVPSLPPSLLCLSFRFSSSPRFPNPLFLFLSSRFCAGSVSLFRKTPTPTDRCVRDDPPMIDDSKFLDITRSSTDDSIHYSCLIMFTFILCYIMLYYVVGNRKLLKDSKHITRLL